MSYECPYCVNGVVDDDYPSSNCRPCEDCGGTGWIPEEGVDFWVCKSCGREFDGPLDGGICEECKEEEED